MPLLKNRNTIVVVGDDIPLSYDYRRAFKYKEFTFLTAHQAVAYEKALFFMDFETANQILTADDPAKVQQLEDHISGVDDLLWYEKAPSIILDILKSKFVQNLILAAYLASTRHAFIGVVDPDTTKGIGYTQEQLKQEPNNIDVLQWKGTNLYGQSLMETRKLVDKKYSKYEPR